MRTQSMCTVSSRYGLTRMTHRSRQDRFKVTFRAINATGEIDTRSGWMARSSHRHHLHLLAYMGPSRIAQLRQAVRMTPRISNTSALATLVGSGASSSQDASTFEVTLPRSPRCSLRPTSMLEARRSRYQPLLASQPRRLRHPPGVPPIPLRLHNRSATSACWISTHQLPPRHESLH